MRRPPRSLCLQGRILDGIGTGIDWRGVPLRSSPVLLKGDFP